MHSAPNGFSRTAALATIAMTFTMMGAAAALAADKPGVDAGRHARGDACETARQQAWFQRQLRTTEGDTEPLVPMTPAACGAMAQDAPAMDAQAANSETSLRKTHVR